MLLLATAFLSGCHGGMDSGVIQVSTFADNQGINTLNEQLQTFTQRTGIKAKAVYVPWNQYNTTLITDFAAGKAPDVMWVEVGPYVPLQHAKALQVLDSYIQRDKVDLKAFYPAVMERFSSDGHVYALPQDTAPLACLYYNRKYFREAHLKYPDEHWTWADFLNASKKLTKRDGRKTLVWGFRDNYAPDWAAMVYANGGLMVDDWKAPKHCLLGSPEAIQGVQFLADMINVQKVSPSTADATTAGGIGMDMFGSGQIAMLHTGYWGSAQLRPYQNLDWDIAPFPKGPKAKEFRWGTGGSGWAMSAGGKNSEKAWQVLKYLASPEVQQATANLGYIQPALISLAHSKAFLNDRAPAHKAMMLDAPNHAVYSPENPHWDEALDSIINPKMDSIMLGQRKAADVLPGIAQEVDEKILNSGN
jgi:multiple sugar transport system substrate-binding protein